METRWVKVRLMDENVPVYGSDSGDSPLLAQLAGQPVVELSSSGTNGRLRIALGDGRQGFVAKDVRCVQMSLWAAAGRIPVHLEATATSPVVATLGSGESLEQFGVTVRTSDGTWIPVLLTNGKPGYMSGEARIVNRGSQVRVQERADDAGRLCTLKDGTLRPIDARVETQKDVAQKNIMIGALFCIGGVIVTALTYSAASDHGGTYLVMWGPVIFGGIRLIKGLAQYFGEA